MPTRIHLRVSEDEYQAIQKNAESAGLTMSAFLRQAGQNIIPRARQDHENLKSLIKVSADMARLGNLLKMALHQDQGWREDAGNIETITELYAAIGKDRELLMKRIKSL